MSIYMLSPWVNKYVWSSCQDTFNLASWPIFAAAERIKNAGVQAGYFMSVGDQMASRPRADVTILSGLEIALQGGSPL